MRQELHDIHLTGNPGDIQSQQPAGLDTGQLTPFDTYNWEYDVFLTPTPSRL